MRGLRCPAGLDAMEYRKGVFRTQVRDGNITDARKDQTLEPTPLIIYIICGNRLFTMVMPFLGDVAKGVGGDVRILLPCLGLYLRQIEPIEETFPRRAASRFPLASDSGIRSKLPMVSVFRFPSN